ncbi:hypothetical protein RUND412_009899 [Rhizina undulata]
MDLSTFYNLECELNFGKVYNPIIENVIAKSSVEFEEVGNTPKDLEDIPKSAIALTREPTLTHAQVQSASKAEVERALKTEVQHTPEPAQPVSAVMYQPSTTPAEYETAPSPVQVQPTHRRYAQHQPASGPDQASMEQRVSELMARNSELAGTIKIKLESLDDDVQHLKRAAQQLLQTELPPQKRVKRTPKPPRGASAHLHPNTPNIPQLDENYNDKVSSDAARRARDIAWIESLARFEVDYPLAPEQLQTSTEDDTELPPQKRVKRTPKPPQVSSAQLHPNTPNIPQLDENDNDKVSSDAARKARDIAWIESLARFAVDYLNPRDPERLQRSFAAYIQSPIIPQHDGNDSNPEATQFEDRDDDPDTINSDLDDSDDEYYHDAAQDENVMPQIMFCTYEQLKRSKSMWKCVLKNGIMNLDGIEYIYHKGVYILLHEY